MALPPRRRGGPRHLLLAWCGYWLALVLVALGPPTVLTWRLTHDPGRHGSVYANLTNDVVRLTVAENGAVRWTGHASFVTIALWLALPPLLLFAAWWRGRPAPAADPHADSLGTGTRAALGDGGVQPGAVPGAVRGRSERVRPE